MTNDSTSSAPGARRLRAGAALLAACLAWPSAAAAQDAPEPAPGEPRCGWCSTTGKLAVETGKEFDVEADAGANWKVLFCSEAIASDNHGLDWQPCARCKTPSLKAAADAEYARLVAEKDAWLATRREIDAAIEVGKNAPVHVETTHFRIVFDIPKITTKDKKNYRTHEAAHLYARRMEDFYERFQRDFGISDKDNMLRTHTIMIFEKQVQAWLAGPLHTGLQGLPTVKRAGGATNESAIVTWWDKGEIPKDEDMWRHQIHHMTHQLTAIYYDPYWFEPGQLGLSPPWLNDKYGWLDAGLAHWFEIDLDGEARTYCFREQSTTSRWGSDDWRKNIYKAVSAGSVPSFPEVITKPTTALTAMEHQFAWSWVDFLQARDKAATGRALKLCKMEVPTRDLLKEAWGLTMIGFEDAWKAWVLETYAPNAKK